MTIVGWFMLVGGLLLAGFCVWQRRGASEPAREWAVGLAPRSREVQVLVVRPLIAVVLLVTPFGSAATSGSAAQVLLLLVFVACAAVVLAYLLVPALLVPSWLMPKWYRTRVDAPGRPRG